jgi:hypothetical protein
MFWPKPREHRLAPRVFRMATAHAAFSIAGIASAFIYAKDTSPALHTQAPAVSAPAETTGSGGAGDVK